MAKRSQDRHRAENEELRLRLEEAEQALEAIRTGQVESLVVEGPDGGLRIFSLEGAVHSYRVLVESMNEGAATLDAEGTVLYCNGRFAALLDRPLQQVMGSAFPEHVAARSRPALDDLLGRAREGSARAELPLRTADGREIPAYLSVSTIAGAGTRVVCLVATDLREQRRNEAIAAAEQTARESEERLRQTLRYASAGTWEWDVRSGRVAWSRESYDLYGVEPSGGPLTGADWERAVHPDDLGAARAALTDCVEGRTAEYRAEFRVRDARCGERWLLGIGRAERAPDGSAIRMLGLDMDVTERRRAQEALRESERSLREADRRKDEFLGMLSHELRNPLAPIRNSTYILRHADPASEQARRARVIIERQTEHLTRLVDDLLDVTRIARGKIELRRERVDLREIVQRAADDFRSLMEDRGVEFRTAIPDAKLPVDADQVRVAQVLGNLLHNAAKFTRRGDEVSLALSVEGTHAEIRVRDTGAGIEGELLARLFDPFVQGERTLARSEGGLGLGLALVKGIAELHGGGVRAESAGRGRGAEFVVRLPLAASTAPQDRRSGGAGRRGSSRRVLVVDDNADAAESLAEALRMLGHAVEVAFDGPSAIEKARATRPEVVLCDVGLPGMSGYDLARTLRASGSNGMLLIAVSGYALPEDVKKAVDAGFDGHVAKPCDPEQLERLLT